MTSKVLLVGELSPYDSNDYFALYPMPRNRAGDRLRKILGMRDDQYLSEFDRTNLCCGEWSWTVSEERADWLLQDHDRIVALGAKVAKAFRLPYVPFSLFHPCWPDPSGPPCERKAILVLPHPSGRCRTWNDEEQVMRARKVVHAFGRIPL